jgi:DNA-directed RNA polymerase specialized sigma subunit
MCHLEGREMAEVGAALGVTAARAQQLVARSLARMRAAAC